MRSTVVPKILRLPLLSAALSVFLIGGRAEAAPPVPRDADTSAEHEDAPSDEDEARVPEKKVVKKADKKKVATKASKKDKDKATKGARADKKTKGEKADKKVASKGPKKDKASKGKGSKADKKVATKDKAGTKGSKGTKGTGTDQAGKDQSRGDRVASRSKGDDGVRTLSGTRSSRSSHPPKSTAAKSDGGKGRDQGAKDGAAPGEDVKKEPRRRTKVSRRAAQEKRNEAIAEESKKD